MIPRAVLLTALLAAASLPAPVAVAEPPDRTPAADAAYARDAARRGEFVRLTTLLDDAERRYPGRVIEVELDDGEYEIEILMGDGRVVELTYDARTGRLLDIEIDD